ncbi:type I-E CRISPR-associated protein Cas6/Cse3/CasE [Planobispora takensis]|uniref:Type I-E CRISPR-associated protein Cas6/Cse3/CasE n=1 Tax=Planobispora takensis TaxID=1367882 RepID=A0A8J3WWZ3_9ACTN|nr:type I-E CRISPR-associated protein Cas6/Cse3/CasE [Planobispora takensis]GII05484.1 type I-E CRISPR-associated protein Cas6/Cse3/CasE [Planobispora takensis]
MFLSKLKIDVTSREFRRDYADVHQMHRTVMTAFPQVEGEQPPRQEHGVLWRLDQSEQGFLLYVQSHVEPDWSGLPKYYLSEPYQVRDLQPLFAAITGGHRFAFRLVANPTRAVKRDEKQQNRRAEQGKRDQPRRVVHRTPEAQINWIIRQGERNGFVIPAGRNGRPDVAPSPAFRMQGKTHVREEAQKLTIDHVRYDGHLIVTDSNLFASAVRNGIGRGKAYGCGLLSLAPAR